MSLWLALERMADGPTGDGAISALPSVWREVLGGSFADFRSSFLRSTTARAATIPCPEHCGCAHEIVEHGDGSLVGVCRCDSWGCDDLPLTAPDVTPLALNLPRLGRAIAQALDCEVRDRETGISCVRQIGAFGATAMPVLFTIPCDADSLTHRIAELTARLRSPFALWLPTSRRLELRSRELLTGVGAATFSLDTHVQLLPGGRLHTSSHAGELFSDLLPDRRDPMEPNEARRLFHMVEKLRSQHPHRKAPVHDVFALLVLEGRTQREAADACACSTGLISTRVRELENEFGTPLAKLRALATS